MEEKHDQDLNDFKNITNDQDRLHFQLISIWDKKTLDSQKFAQNLREFKLTQKILYSLITLGIIVFFILILININLIIIIIDIGIVALYIFYLKHTKYTIRKSLKITKGELKLLKILKKKDIVSIIFYSILIFTTIVILIFSMTGINPLVVIVIISIFLIGLYFNKIIYDSYSSDS